MAIAYRAVPLAEVCYIFEVTHWLALGKLPEFMYDQNGHEARLSPTEHDDHFEPILDAQAYLDEDEVSTFLPGVKQSEYFDGLSEDYAGTPDEIIAKAHEFFDRLNDGMDSEELLRLSEHRDDELKRAEVVRWFRSIEKPVDRLLDQARAKTFLALSNGSLKAKGYVLRVDEERDFQYCESVDISPESWSLDDINWESASTVVDGVEVKCAHVRTDDMLSLFPLSETLGNPLSGKVFGSTFIPDTETSIPVVLAKSQGRRGRPKIGHGIVETAIGNEYRRLLHSGELFEKREANIQHMIDWAKNILGEQVTRTSVQRWLDKIEDFAQK